MKILQKPELQGGFTVGGVPVVDAYGRFVTLQGFDDMWFVDTVNGNDENSGRAPDEAFETMAAAFEVIESHDTISFVGKVKEQLVAPLGVYGVKIIGADTTPRHDLAASWTIPDSPAATTPLLRLREQGWVLSNFLMYGTTDSAAVMLKRREDATDPDASHAQFLGMRFVGNYIGIEDNGGHFNVTVDGCTFQDNTNGGIKSTSTTIAAPLMWRIVNNRFKVNASPIVMPFSSAFINNNTFIGSTTAVINLTGGTAPNIVTFNTFDIDAADFDPAGGVTGVSGDVWHNLLKDAIETGLPAN